VPYARLDTSVIPRRLWESPDLQKHEGCFDSSRVSIGSQMLDTGCTHAESQGCGPKELVQVQMLAVFLLAPSAGRLGSAGFDMTKLVASQGCIPVTGPLRCETDDHWHMFWDENLVGQGLLAANGRGGHHPISHNKGMGVPLLERWCQRIQVSPPRVEPPCLGPARQLPAHVCRFHRTC
jgi:hypothetical protein